MQIGRTQTCLAAIGIYSALRLIAAYVRPAHIPPIVLLFIALLSIAALMFMNVGIVVSFTGIGLRSRTAGFIALGAVTCYIIAYCAGVYVEHHKIALLLPIVGLFADLSLMMAATSVGYIVSFIIREPGIIVPVAICSALVDYVNVNYGFLGQLVESHPEIVSKVTVHIPTMSPGIPPTMMGAGDVLFLGIFFGALWRFSMNVKTAFWAAFVLLTLSIYLVLLPWAPALPALVPMAIAIILSNWNNFHLKKDELQATLLVFGLLLVLLLAAVRHMNRIRSIGSPAPTQQEVRQHSHHKAPAH